MCLLLYRMQDGRLGEECCWCKVTLPGCDRSCRSSMLTALASPQLLSTEVRCDGVAWGETGHSVEVYGAVNIGKSEADIITCRNLVKVLDVDRGSLDSLSGEG